MTARRSPSHAVLLVSISLAGTACSTPNNDRLSLGTSSDPVFTPTAVKPTPALTEAEQQSVTGIDRSHWHTTDFIVANDAVEHYPHFTRLEPRFDDGTARARGDSPTALTALEMEGDSGAIILETLAWPGYVIGDIIMIIPRAIDPDQRSPMTSYERSPLEVPPPTAAEVDAESTRQVPPTPTRRTTSSPHSVGAARR